MLPTNGTFASLLTVGGLYIASDPTGAVVFRPRPDLPQNFSVVNNYLLFDKSPQGSLAKAVATRDPQIVNTWIGLPVMTPGGKGVLLSVDLSAGPTGGLCVVQMADANGTQRLWKSADLSINFQ